MKRPGFVFAVTALAACPILAEPPAPPQPAPVVLGAAPDPGAPKTLADVARERKLNRSPAAKGSFSATESTVAQGTPDSSKEKKGLVAVQTDAAKAAQDRMDRAVKDGVWTDENINHNTGIRNSARADWDAAAENCRKTPGCNPVNRSDGAHKALKTDEERLYDYSKKLGLSGAKKPDYAP